jgi:uncharacterized protein YdaU (DUF1376 family)
MSFAYLALYTGDYLRDTRHLTPLRHGVYLLLLMHSWDSRGPVPLDEQEAAGIANCRSADEVDALRYVLQKFFTKMEDGWYNRRIQLEIERAHAIGLKRSVAGAKGYQAKAKQMLSKCLARASNTTTTTISTPTTINTKTARAKARCVCPEGFGNPFTPALQEWLDKRGETQTKAHLIHFIGYVKANGKMYADWDQAFKNAVRDDWAGIRKVTA